jgi:pimeloyl-ACP methyl ester carboxylesterase
MIAEAPAVERPSALSQHGKLWKSYYLRANGLRTRFITAGEGEPLLLLHGSAPGASSETNFHMNIAALTEHFRVYGLDQVGYGRTEAPPGRDVLGNEQFRVDHLLPSLRAFHEFDSAGHHVQTDQHEAFNAKVIEFRRDGQ